MNVNKQHGFWFWFCSALLWTCSDCNRFWSGPVSKITGRLLLMGRQEAESGLSFCQENLWFHALFAGYFKFMLVLSKTGVFLFRC